MPSLTKHRIDKTVWEASLERIHLLYDRFDTVMVSFSGGKDSTVVLNLTLEVAREHERLPLDVCFVDEEAITPETVEYVERVLKRDDVRLKWVCLPRHNRARGTHGVLKMADIVRQMIESGVSEKELMQRLGMEREEVARLNNRAGMPQQVKTTSFNQAWVPRRADSP